MKSNCSFHPQPALKWVCSLWINTRAGRLWQANISAFLTTTRTSDVWAHVTFFPTVVWRKENKVQHAASLWLWWTRWHLQGKLASRNTLAVVSLRILSERFPLHRALSPRGRQTDVSRPLSGQSNRGESPGRKLRGFRDAAVMMTSLRESALTVSHSCRDPPRRGRAVLPRGSGCILTAVCVNVKKREKALVSGWDSQKLEAHLGWIFSLSCSGLLSWCCGSPRAAFRSSVCCEGVY